MQGMPGGAPAGVALFILCAEAVRLHLYGRVGRPVGSWVPLASSYSEAPSMKMLALSSVLKSSLRTSCGMYLRPLPGLFNLCLCHIRHAVAFPGTMFCQAVIALRCACHGLQNYTWSPHPSSVRQAPSTEGPMNAVLATKAICCRQETLLYTWSPLPAAAHVRRPPGRWPSRSLPACRSPRRRCRCCPASHPCA